VKLAAASIVALVTVAQIGSATTDSPPLDLLTQLLSALGPMGFVMWLVVRTTNHTIPRLAKSFEEALDRARVDFRSILTDQRTDFLALLDRERTIQVQLLDHLAGQRDKDP